MTCQKCGAQSEKELCPACEAENTQTNVPESDVTQPETAAAVPESDGEEPEIAEEETERAPADDLTGGEEEEEPSEAPADGTEEATLDDILDDDDEDLALTEKTTPPAKKKGLLAFVISLVLIAALGVGAFFVFFWQGGGGSADASAIMKTFNNFNAAMQKGDIEEMRSFILPEDLAEGDVPMFGPIDDMKAALQEEGSYGDMELDFSSDNAMVKSFVNGLQLSFTVHSVDDVVMGEADEEGKFVSATVFVDQTFSMQGQKQKAFYDFSMVKQNGKWYISTGY